MLLREIGRVVEIVLVAVLSLAMTSGCAVGVDGPGEIGASQYGIWDSTRPDEALTPGALCTAEDKDFDGYRYAEQIPHCKRSVSKARKVRVARAYGVSAGELGAYEIDHRISLSLGGSNADENLRPLLHEEARRKAELEQQLYLQLDRGEITQAEAIAQVLAWE